MINFYDAHQVFDVLPYIKKLPDEVIETHQKVLEFEYQTLVDASNLYAPRGLFDAIRNIELENQVEIKEIGQSIIEKRYYRFDGDEWVWLRRLRIVEDSQLIQSVSC